MPLPSFDVDSPANAREACELLAEHGDDATVYSGGTELVLMLKLGLSSYRRLIDLKRIDALKRLELDGDRLVVGAGVTHRELEHSPVVAQAFPALAQMERIVANVRVRAAGTLGGNLCFNDPHSDPATFLLVAGGDMVVEGRTGSRTIPVEDFTVGPYQTALGLNEILREIHVQLPPAGAGIAHVKLAFHERPAATVTCLVAPGSNGRAGDVRLAAGAVGVRALRLRDAERLLAQVELRRPDSEQVEAAVRAAAAECEASADENGAVDYKQHLVSVLVRRAFTQALERLRAAAA